MDVQAEEAEMQVKLIRVFFLVKVKMHRAEWKDKACIYVDLTFCYK